MIYNINDISRGKDTSTVSSNNLMQEIQNSRIYKTPVQLVVIFCSEAWILKVSDENTLSVFKSRTDKYGLIREDDDC